jgi:hypothetical protein
MTIRIVFCWSTSSASLVKDNRQNPSFLCLFIPLVTLSCVPFPPYCSHNTLSPSLLSFRSHSSTPWSWALFEKPPILKLLKNFAAFYGTRRFITVFTRALHCPYPEPDQSNPSHPISLRSILMLFTLLFLGLPSSLVPSGFPTNILCACLLSPFVLHVLPVSYSLTWSF